MTCSVVRDRVRGFFPYPFLWLFSLLLNWEKRNWEKHWKFLFVLWIEWGGVRIGRGAKKGCIIPSLPGPEPWKRLEQLLGALSCIAGEQPLPCHDIAPEQTVPNSSAVPHLFPLRCWRWFPTLPVTLKQIIGANKYRDPSGSVPLFFPKITCSFFHVNLQKNFFGVIYNLLLIFLFSWPCSSQLQSPPSQDKSKYF